MKIFLYFYLPRTVPILLGLALGIFIFLFLPITASAAQFDYDLGIRSEDISFSKQKLITSQKIRVYATVYNFGANDMTAFVSFYQGAQLLGDSQPVSVKAGGFADEVFIDFVVPAGPFNILAAIRGSYPEDQNPANNEALTPLITPLTDSDSDGVPDQEDNCPAIGNFDQKNSDGDSLGDVCDSDNDNDGLSDVKERQLGTNPFKPDTDGDGLIDSKDPLPLRKIEEEMKPVVSSEKSPSVPLLQRGKQIKSPSAPLQSGKKEDKKQPVSSTVSASQLPLKIVRADYEKLSWKKFAFFAEAVGGAGEYQWTWRPEGEKTILGQNVFYEYSRTGDYLIQVNVRDAAGNEEKTEFSLSISFFNFSNLKLWLFLGILFVLAGILFVVSRRQAHSKDD